MDSDYFDNGAAGISLAFSGEISSSSAQKLNSVKNSSISGEVASGAVVRTYSSTQTGAFVAGNMVSSVSKAERLVISGVNIADTQIKGTHIYPASTYVNILVSSGGIIARVSCSGVEHTITNCTHRWKRLLVQAA